MSNRHVAQASGPILRILTKVQRYLAESLLARTNCQKILIEPRFAVPVEQTGDKGGAVAADQHMAALRILEQRAHTGLIENDIDRLKTAYRFIRKRAGMRFIADAKIAA